MQIALLIIPVFCFFFVFSRPLPDEAAKNCDFHKYELKQPHLNFPAISKSKIDGCQGPFKKLSEIVGNIPLQELYGANNESQLILARAGMFPEGSQFIQFEKKVICKAHLNELYSGFEKSGHILVKQDPKTRKESPACSFPAKHDDKKVLGKSRLTFEESKAIFMQHNKLVVQTGITLCSTEKRFAANQVQEWKDSQANLSPLPPRKPVQIPEESFCENDDNENDPDFPPPSKKQDPICTSLAQFALSIGMTRASSKVALNKMTPATRKKKYNLGYNLLDQMCKVMGGEEKEDLKEQICTRVLGYHFHKESDIDVFLKNVSQLYLESSDKFAKRHYLSFIVGIVPYSKISKYLPSISRYHYDKAVKYALQAPKIQRETYKRERFDSLKVDPFIDFISSDIVVTGLPFGTKTLKLSNTKLEIPSTLRLQKHFEIIEMFENHMQERGQSHLVLPRSTMFHLLEVCSAKRTTAITCVDYFISNGIDGMNDIINLIDKWGQKGTFTLHDTKVLKHHVLESLQYLRTQYLVNVNETSNVPSHCAKHALSSATDGRMQANERDHEHDGFCERCLKLVKTMEKVNSLAKLQKENIEADDIVDQRLLREAEEDLSVAQNAIESIKKLQEHFLKSVYSDEYRKFIIENVIDDQTALLTIDFAQKYLQDWYKQTQQQYFARRGMSWEVTHVFIKKNGELLEHTFIHLIENEKQDARTVLAILKDVLLKLKEQNIVKVVARTDNAGCYHCKDVLMSLKHVIKETGVKILRWSFSEPQSGKSSADRKAATVKTRLRAHLDKKNNIESEADMFTALTNPHPLRYMTITRATVDSSTPVPNSVDSTPLPNSAPIAPKTFPSVKHFFDFEVREPYVIGRHAHNIGNGHDIYFEHFESFVQKQSLHVIETSTSANFWNNVNRPESIENEEGLFACNEENCVATFGTHQELQSHLHVGIHNFTKENQSDHAMKRFKKRLEEMVSDQAALSNSNVIHAALSQFSGTENMLAHYPRGWALVEEKKTVKRFTDDQKAFMTELYDRGVQNSKDKVRPEEAEIMMRTAQVDGYPRFKVADVLNKQQIKSFFGNLGKKKKDRATQQERDIEEIRNNILEEARRILPELDD